MLAACAAPAPISSSPAQDSGSQLPAVVQERPVVGQSEPSENAVKVPAQAALAGDVDDQTVESASPPSAGAVTERLIRERATALDPYVITAHKPNFIFPLSFTSNINREIYEQNDVPLREGLEPVEVTFQISLKTSLNQKDLLFANDSLSLGITLQAWWQLYSSDLSSPFRESNYQPEVFYLVPLLWGPFGGNIAMLVGLEHQSNGQVQGLSRSWNRVYAAMIYERGEFVASIHPWYRIPEKAKESPELAKGDDNPDISDFMGHGDIKLGWRNYKYEFAMLARGNPSTGKGAIKLGMTFPFFARLKGYVEYFNGYGDSLIDYNHRQQRLGLGIALTNLF